MIKLPYRMYNIGRWKIDCLLMTISTEDKSIVLTTKIFELLKLFIVADEHLITKKQAIELLWQNDFISGNSGFIHAVFTLRKAFSDLGANSNEVISTIQQIGYKLIITPECVRASNENEGRKSKNKAIRLFLGTAILALFFLLLYKFGSTTSKKYNSYQIIQISDFDGLESYPEVSPDGDFIAFQWTRKNQLGQIYIKSLENDEAPLIKLSNKEVDDRSNETLPIWSPDGQSVAYFALQTQGKCEVRVFHLLSYEDQYIDHGCDLTKNGKPLIWSRDGKTLIYNKAVGESIMLNSYNFEHKQFNSVTFPKDKQADVSVELLADTNQIVVLRTNPLFSELILINNYLENDRTEEILLKQSNGLISIAWHERLHKLILAIPKKYSSTLVSFDLLDKQQKLITTIPTDDLISINSAGDIYFSSYIDSELDGTIPLINKHSFPLDQLSVSDKEQFNLNTQLDTDLFFITI